jgi:hypothetical protein
LADPKFVKAYGKAIAGHDDLDQMQFMQFFLLTRAQLLGMENQHDQYLQGLLDSEKYSSYQIALREQFFAFPGIRALWKMVRHSFSNDFVVFVDKNIAATPMHQESVFEKWKALVAAERNSKPKRKRR